MLGAEEATSLTGGLAVIPGRLRVLGADILAIQVAAPPHTDRRRQGDSLRRQHVAIETDSATRPRVGPLHRPRP